jgi:hypothetical protein
MPDTLDELLAEAGASAPANPLLEGALYNAQQGRRVFALTPCGKVPLKGTHGFKDATLADVTIRRLWDIQPRANVGIRTGDGLLVLDVDPRHDGDATLAALQKEHGALPKTPLVLTGGGGEHFYFRVDRAIKSGAHKLGPGLDIKCEDAYVVAPPSVHESGRAYVWSIDNHPDEVAIAPAPEWLLRLAGGGRDNIVRLPQPPSAWRKLAAERVPDGARNNALVKLAGHLLRRDVDAIVVRELLLGWNQRNLTPPLSDAVVTRTVERIWEAERRRRGDA